MIEKGKRRKATVATDSVMPKIPSSGEAEREAERQPVRAGPMAIPIGPTRWRT